MSITKAAFAALCACGLYAMPATAGLIFTATDYDNASLDIGFDVGFFYNHSPDGTSATIDITIGNPATNPGYVSATGFAFNAPTGYDISLDAFSFDSTYSSAVDSGELGFDGIRAGSYGKFDLGVSTDKIKNSINGGTPRYGIRPAETARFSLGLSGSNLDELDEYDFLLLGSSGTSFKKSRRFVVRWQSYSEWGDPDLSGFASGDIPAPLDPSGTVPAPGALLLCCIGAGFVGLKQLRRRLRG